MDSYDEIHDALQDVTNNPDEPVADDDDAQFPAQDKKPALLNPQEAGWSEPVPFTYDRFAIKDFTDWAGIAPRYEWKEEYGEVGPRNVELERQLFNAEFVPRAGERFNEWVLQVSLTIFL
jgi:ATP-dependent RNA helicase DDX3X